MEWGQWDRRHEGDAAGPASRRVGDATRGILHVSPRFDAHVSLWRRPRGGAGHVAVEAAIMFPRPYGAPPRRRVVPVARVRTPPPDGRQGGCP